MLRTILQADPHVGVILEAEDGLTALELVRREQPHLVVTDLMMPRHYPIGDLRSVSPIPYAAGSRQDTY